MREREAPGRQGHPDAQSIGILQEGRCTKLGPERVGNRYGAWQVVGKMVPTVFIPELLFQYSLLKYLWNQLHLAAPQHLLLSISEVI